MGMLWGAGRLVGTYVGEVSMYGGGWWLWGEVQMGKEGAKGIKWCVYVWNRRLQAGMGGVSAWVGGGRGGKAGVGGRCMAGELIRWNGGKAHPHGPSSLHHLNLPPPLPYLG